MHKDQVLLLSYGRKINNSSTFNQIYAQNNNFLFDRSTIGFSQ